MLASHKFHQTFENFCSRSLFTLTSEQMLEIHFLVDNSN